MGLGAGPHLSCWQPAKFAQTSDAFESGLWPALSGSFLPPPQGPPGRGPGTPLPRFASSGSSQISQCDVLCSLLLASLGPPRGSLKKSLRPCQVLLSSGRRAIRLAGDAIPARLKTQKSPSGGKKGAAAPLKPLFLLKKGPIRRFFGPQHVVGPPRPPRTPLRTTRR